MVEGGARTTGAAPGSAAAVVEAQAIEAAARSIAEDLAHRLAEAR
jgi:galactokinase